MSIDNAKILRTKTDFKVGIYLENNEVMMSLEFKESDLLVQIPKICLSRLNCEINCEVINKTYSCLEFNTIKNDSQLIIPILSDEKGILFQVTDLKPKKKMTLEEVEKELGYKIKLEN